MRCKQCGFESPDQFKYCGECGAKMTGRDTPEAASIKVSDVASRTKSKEAERRHLSVMFCDLVGSTQLSEKLDPEEFREILRAYQDTSAFVINKFGGYIAQYLGDGILVYFGYPQAHGDDAQRALQAGLELITEMRQLSKLQQREKNLELLIRIGVHTGLVVVGELGSYDKHEELALGNTPNIAARIQNLADPNTLFISEATYRLVQGEFRCQALGPISLKGVSRNLKLFRVIKHLTARDRLRVAITTDQTSLIGRDNEVGKLKQCWEKVKIGKGQIAMIIGESGMGKSHLLHSFELEIKNEPHTWLICRCWSYFQNTAFYPIIILIQGMLKFEPADSDEIKIQKLEEGLRNFDFDLFDVIPPLTYLLSIASSEKYPRPNLSPPKLKQKIIEILLQWSLRISERRPLFFVIEDLHWADPSTLEHLSMLLEVCKKARMLIVLTFHPQFKPTIPFKSSQTEILLQRLARKHVEKMVDQISGGKDLPQEVFDLLVEKTDGVPLYVEELTRMILTSGLLSEKKKKYTLQGPIPANAIPDRLQDVLMARLDKLGASKEVVQIAATIGREFTYKLIKEVSLIEDSVLQNELENLVHAKVLDRQGDPPAARYTFRQALIQDAAYHSLLRSTRHYYHRKIGQILEEQFSDNLQNNPEMLAHHYSEAGIPEKAVQFYIKAGQLSVQQSANKEAIAQFNKAQKLLLKLAVTQERVSVELELLISQGVPLLATKGYAAPEVGAIYQRARELSQEVGDIPHLYPAMQGLYRYYLIKGELEKAIDISELLLTWSRTSKNENFLLEAWRATGVCLFHQGNFADAAENLKLSISMYESQKHKHHALLYGSDPKVTCLSYLALSQCLLGNAAGGLKSAEEAIELAKKLDHPFSIAFSLNHFCWLNQFLEKADEVEKYSVRLIELACEQGFAFWQAAGLVFKGWVIAFKGNNKDGFKTFAKGINGFKKTGAGLVLPYFLTILAERYMLAGDFNAATKSINEARSVASKNGELMYSAEIYRIEAELTYHRSAENNDAVEKLYLKSIKTSQKQSSPSFQLRSTMHMLLVLNDLVKKQEYIKQLRFLYTDLISNYMTSDLLRVEKILAAES